MNATSFELDETGPGVFLMGREWDKSFLRPKEALPAIPGSLGDERWEKATAIFINISARHNAWCGVEWTRLKNEIPSRNDDPMEYEEIKEAIEDMIRMRLLEIPGYKGWLSFLNLFFPQIVCPTRILLTKIQANKRG